MSRKRINFEFESNIIEVLDMHAKEYGVTRTAMLSVMIKTFDDQKKALELGQVVDKLDNLSKLKGVKKN